MFRFIAEGFFDHARQWSTQVLEVRKTSEGPIRVGTRGLVVGLGTAARTESSLEVLEYEPNQVFSCRVETLPAGSMSRRGTTPLLTRSVMTFRFESVGSDTSVMVVLETDMTGYPWLFRRRVSGAQPGGLASMAERIKTLLESRAGNL